MACPAGTVYRNYFWNGRGQSGGSQSQINTARDLARLVDNEKHNYWNMKNGYLLPARSTAMAELGERLESGSVEGKDANNNDSSAEDLPFTEKARRNLRVGIHWDTATARDKDRPDDVEPHRVCQVSTLLHSPLL